jgi:hypothetical protein
MDLLAYTPPQDRDLREPWVNIPSGEQIDWDRPLAFWCHAYCFDPLPAGAHRLGLVALIQASTANLEHYQDGTDEEYVTDIVFHDRASFKSAYGLARAIQNGRADMESIAGSGLTIYLSSHHQIPHLRVCFGSMKEAA